jgi:class 3 adenylate cyclase
LSARSAPRSDSSKTRRNSNLQVHAGLHIGEVREEGGLLRGIAVHVAARVMSEAQGGEILISETVRDVVAGANLSFSDRGARQLKGIEGRRRLFAVTVESDGR